MNWYKKYNIAIAIWAGLGLISVKANCQSISTDSLLSKALSSDQLLPVLINSAQKFSPEVRRIKASIDLASTSLKIEKNAIYNSLSFLSSYHYGTNYSAVSAVSDVSRPNNFTTTQTGFYNVGVGLQLPLTQIINRKHLIKSGESQIEMALAEKGNSDLYIKQEVIRLYQELKLSQRLMFISSSNKQSAQVNYKMIEKDFLQNQVNVEQVARVLDIFNKSKIEYETYLNRFQTSLMQLDAYTGISLSTLLKQIK
ncbi:TolC family protein [Emticicia sp.]|uniref:TolC family protein n=1 Tax=Emticicia sp. TaxID=1930953 RepID=UPI0037506AB7